MKKVIFLAILACNVNAADRTTDPKLQKAQAKQFAQCVKQLTGRFSMFHSTTSKIKASEECRRVVYGDTTDPTPTE